MLTVMSTPLTHAADTGSRYAAKQQLLHWIAAVSMFALLPLAWVAMALPDDAQVRLEQLLAWHEGLGIIVLALAC